MSAIAVILTAEQLALAQSAVSGLYDDIARSRKKAHKRESTPEGVKAARRQCKVDLEACNALWILLENSRAEQGRPT